MIGEDSRHTSCDLVSQSRLRVDGLKRAGQTWNGKDEGRNPNKEQFDRCQHEIGPCGVQCIPAVVKVSDIFGTCTSTHSSSHFARWRRMC